jgi:hypothetical protein
LRRYSFQARFSEVREAADVFDKGTSLNPDNPSPYLSTKPVMPAGLAFEGAQSQSSARALMKGGAIQEVDI